MANKSFGKNHLNSDEEDIYFDYYIEARKPDVFRKKARRFLKNTSV